jgi:hypothetical protein
MAVLAIALSALGQEQGRRGGRRRLFGRDGVWNQENSLKSIKAIEEQLAKLKDSQMPQPEIAYQDLTNEERTKLIGQVRKFAEKRMESLQVITNQVAKLQGQRQLEGENEHYLIISTIQLKQIQESAKKEKAKETSELIDRTISRASMRGFGVRSRGGNRPPSN